MTENNHLRGSQKAVPEKTHTGIQDYSSQFRPYMSHNSDRGLQRGSNYISPGSPIQVIPHFHPPLVHRSSSESLERIPFSTGREQSHQFHSPRQQVSDSENFESTQSSMFPHDTTDESTKFIGEEQAFAEDQMSGTSSWGHLSVPPQFPKGSSTEMSPRLRHQDALFDPPDIETDTEDNLIIAPSETDICSASSIHSSYQELALQMINLENEDWSS